MVLGTAANPVTVGTAAGLLLAVTGFRPPQVVWTPITMLGERLRAHAASHVRHGHGLDAAGLPKPTSMRRRASCQDARQALGLVAGTAWTPVSHRRCHHCRPGPAAHGQTPANLLATRGQTILDRLDATG